MYNNFIIISAEIEGKCPVENVEATRQLVNSLDALESKYKHCEGMYEGRKETSFLVELTKKNNLQMYLGVSNHFDQECILHVNFQREAFLVSGVTNDKVGYWCAIGEHTASESRAYTKINNDYYKVI